MSPTRRVPGTVEVRSRLIEHVVFDVGGVGLRVPEGGHFPRLGARSPQAVLAHDGTDGRCGDFGPAPVEDQSQLVPAGTAGFGLVELGHGGDQFSISMRSWSIPRG